MFNEHDGLESLEIAELIVKELVDDPRNVSSGSVRATGAKPAVQLFPPPVAPRRHREAKQNPIHEGGPVNGAAIEIEEGFRNAAELLGISAPPARKDKDGEKGASVVLANLVRPALPILRFSQFQGQLQLSCRAG